MSSPLVLEGNLVHLSRWALFSVQLLGYVPLSVIKGHVTFKWLSIPVFYNLFLIFLAIGWHIIYFLNYRPVMRIFESGPTEMFANYLMGFVLTGSTLFLKIWGLFNGKCFLKFWGGTVGLCDILWGSGNLYGVATRTKGSGACDKYRKKMRNFVFFVALIAFLHTFYNFTLCIFTGGYYCQHAVKDRIPNGLFKTTFYLGLSMWHLMVVLHTLHAAWMIFFIRMYQVGFQLVIEEIKNIISEVDKKSYSPVDVFFANFKPGSNITTNKNDWDNLKVSIDAKFPYVDVNEKVSDFSHGMGLGVKRSRRITPEQDERLNKCLDAFLSVEDQVDSFNNHFGLKLILEIGICIAVILTYAFFAMLFITRNHYKSLLSIIGPFTIFVGELISLATASTSMTSQAKAVLRQMQLIPYTNLPNETQMKMQMMAIRISSNPPVITGCNYFTMNKTIVTSIISAITTYLIVLFQFQNNS